VQKTEGIESVNKEQSIESRKQSREQILKKKKKKKKRG
jgi:hypothetical protein